MAEQSGFVCYRQTLQTLIMLPDESAGRVIKAAASSFLTCAEISDDFALHERIVLQLFLNDIDGAKAQYQKICQRNRTNRNRRADNSGDQLSPVVTTSDQPSPVGRNMNLNLNLNLNPNSESENTTEGKPPRASRFTPPSVEEVKTYCTERQNGVDAQRFVDFYTANGWTQGRGKPIKDWKATVRTWEGREDKPAQRDISSPDRYTYTREESL